MVRGLSDGTGFFNTNFEIKIIYLLLTIVLILIDFKQFKRKNYLYVFNTGSITWTIAELILQLGGIRKLTPVYIFGFELPFLIQVLIKGIVEGAGVAIFCLYFSDRIIQGEKRTRLFYLGIFVLLMLLMIIDAFKFGILEPAYGGEVVSRRSMFEIVPLVFLFEFSAIGFIWLIKTKEVLLKQRALWMFIFMIVFGAIWTLAEYYAGNRWIEIGEFGNSQHAPPIIEFFALMFDIVIEIAAVYLPFFAIPFLTHDISLAKI